MADIKKFLDQAGVSTLWSRVAEEVAKVNAKAVKNANDIAAHGTRLDNAEAKIEALEAGTYDDTELRGLINTNKAAHEANAAAIATLNGTADTVGSVANTATSVAATKVAEIVAGANASFDTLKEIADWILNDTTGAAHMANSITNLQTLVGDKAVAEQIAEAISGADLDKYALAADLTALVNRVNTLEDVGYQTADAVASAIDSKIAALNLAETYDAKGAAAAAETNAKAYADGLASNYDAAGAAAQALVDAKAYTDAEAAKHETKGAAAQALVDAKAYTDAEVAKIQALTEAEIDAAIATAKAQTQA